MFSTERVRNRFAAWSTCKAIAVSTNGGSTLEPTPDRSSLEIGLTLEAIHHVYFAFAFALVETPDRSP